MTMVNDLPAPIWVCTEETFGKMLADLKSQNQIAVDTESNSLYAYQEKVCLIQFSTPKTDYLLDPLCGIDISDLSEVFTDDSIEKIFHAAEYDIICLKRDFKFTFSNLFDTMQAARVLGLSKLGLSSLLEQYFEVKVNKRFQKANWGKRPLTPEMLNYARLDTHFLIQLREVLSGALQKMSRMAVANEDFVRIAHSEASPNHKPCYASIRGYHKLTPQQLSVLNEICTYRERQAFNANLPPFKILSSTLLLETAKACPSSYEELAEIPGFSEKLLKRHAKSFLSAINQGLELPPITLNHRSKPSEDYIVRLERLKRWRVKRARLKGVESDVILSREKLEELAKKNPATSAELAELMHEMPERFRLYQEKILRVLKGE